MIRTAKNLKLRQRRLQKFTAVLQEKENEAKNARRDISSGKKETWVLQPDGSHDVLFTAFHGEEYHIQVFNRKSLCTCGSGKTMRHCHPEKIIQSNAFLQRAVLTKHQLNVEYKRYRIACQEKKQPCMNRAEYWEYMNDNGKALTAEDIRQQKLVGMAWRKREQAQQLLESVKKDHPDMKGILSDIITRAECDKLYESEGIGAVGGLSKDQFYHAIQSIQRGTGLDATTIATFGDRLNKFITGQPEEEAVSDRDDGVEAAATPAEGEGISTGNPRTRFANLPADFQPRHFDDRMFVPTRTEEGDGSLGNSTPLAERDEPVPGTSDVGPDVLQSPDLPSP